ncbi:MAG: nicotinate-nucleotide adenylyltransferase [Pseudomonadota bacterium]
MNQTHIFAPPTLHDGFRWSGKRIGLLGGSFNPPHAGHLHIARLARRKLDLDFIWWIVTPQNPLKDRKGMAPYKERYGAVSDMLAPYPNQMPTHLEHELGTQYTFETICGLKHYFPRTDFLWICGMDNAHIFHKWDRWQDILNMIPIVFIARPPAHTLIQNAPIRQLNITQNNITHGQRLDLKKPSISWMMGTKMMDISSTEIRNNK